MLDQEIHFDHDLKKKKKKKIHYPFKNAFLAVICSSY